MIASFHLLNTLGISNVDLKLGFLKNALVVTIYSNYSGSHTLVIGG